MNKAAIPYRNRKWLIQKYWVEKLTLKEVAKSCHVNKQTILSWLRKYNIRTRTLSEALIGRKFTEEHKIKLRNSRNYLKGKEHHWWGRKHTEETKRKMSNTKLQYGSLHYYKNIAYRVWEKFWNQKVPKGYCVHHVDRNISNNDITNLALILFGLHTSLHNRERRIP